MKDRNLMIMSIDTDNAFDKIQLHFHYKNIQQPKNKNKLPQHTNVIYEKPTATINAQWRKTECFLFR
jgi:hypothetical protein